MSTATSKRQQARNERALQELIKTVPGNDRCADCQAKNPGWASWSLGIYLCMRCASLHRKLGTHISKVKSLSMDSWSNDQVSNMKSVGNVASNRIFTPNNSKPNLPLDVDEVDSAMERFIRQKYEQRLFQGGHIGRNIRHNTGSTSTSSDEPPPLPPKPGNRFGLGLRAASSTFPLSSASRLGATSTPQSAAPSGQFRRGSSPPRARQHPAAFGLSVESDDHNSKLATLAEMGFPDASRNGTVLNGLGGNLERAIETLIRLGEGGSHTKSQARVLAAGGQNSMSSSTHSNVQAPPPASNASQPSQPSPHSVVSLAPQQSPTQGNSYNPFLQVPSGQKPTQQPLDSAFQKLQISPQPLFPNATGGFPQQPHHEVSYYQTLTPPLPAPSQQNYFSSLSQPQANPFTQNQYPQAQSSGNSNPFASQASPFAATNPFQNQTTHQQGQAQGYPTPQYSYPTSQPPQILSGNIAQQQPHAAVQMGSQEVQVQPSGRADKSSILALYDYPQLAPAPDTSVYASSPSMLVTSGDAKAAVPPLNIPPSGLGSAQRSFSMPIGQSTPGSRNPFLTNGRPTGQDQTAPAAANPPARGGGMSRHVSQESVDVGNWHQSGRHSPDAFASLSSRFVR